MSQPNKRIQRVLNEFESLHFFGPAARFPRQFYDLNAEEQAETIKVYKERLANRKGRPYKETK